MPTMTMKHLQKLSACILVAALMLSMLCFAPAASAQSASGVYASYLKLLTTDATDLVDLPSSSGQTQISVPSGTQLTAVALHTATDDSFWYEVVYNGALLYVAASDAVTVTHLTDDVTTSDIMLPAATGYGNSFAISGMVGGGYNSLDNVTVSVHKRGFVSSTPLLVGSASKNGYAVSLDAIHIPFETLPAGYYTIVLTAQLTSHYIDTNGQLATVSNAVTLQSKNCVISDDVTADTATGMGVDVSAWTGNVDWAKVADQVDFALIQTDSKFATNAAGCAANGIPFGVYHYTAAKTETEAIAEAELVIQTLYGHDSQLPVFFNVESATLPSEQLQSVARAFCDTVAAAGYQPGLYTYPELLDAHFSDEYFDTVAKWVCEADQNSCSYTGGVTAWQYSWAGRVDGIRGDVSCNYYYGQLPGHDTQCDHPLWDYSFTENSHVTTCTVCGERTASAAEGEPFKINSASLELANNINVIYHTTLPAGFSDAYMVFDAYNTSTTVSHYSTGTDGRYRFSYEGIKPHLMGENICATLYATFEGKLVRCIVAQYSVRQYCVKQFSKDPSPALRQLLSDLLIYGEKAQNYMNYNPDQPVTDGLDLTPSTFQPLGDAANKQVISGEANSTIDYNSASLTLSNNVAIRLRISADDVSAYTYRITVNDIPYDYTAEQLTKIDDYYYLDFDKLYVTQFDQVITATILQGETQVGRTVQYSINSYIFKNQATSDTALREILQAVSNYSVSAGKYVSSL